MKKNAKVCSPRLGTVGGQAVIEGVMMKSQKLVALSVRKTDGTITTSVEPCHTIRDKYKILNLPILRGIVNFGEQMILSFKTLSASADMLGIEEEESKFEKWLMKVFGKNIAVIASFIGTVLGLFLAVGLFIALPAFLSDLFEKYVSDVRFLKSLVDGVSKMLIFLLYLALVSLIPDMRRVFQYHGAEHKSIFCHEGEEELTVENVRKQSRFHPRCGTSFLVVLMFIGILVSMLYIKVDLWLRIPIKLLALPLIVGIGFEFIRYAGRHNNLLVRILSAPGLWVQRLTTKEPDDGMIEVAIASLKAALPEYYPPEVTEDESEAAEDNDGEENKKEETDS